ncbi:MAG: helix-turn-helix domain-containing protein [Blastocatellales bacterium]
MKHSGRETLAARVKRIREEKNLSLIAVERNCDGRVSNGYISRVENGFEDNLTRDKIAAMAKGLQVPPIMLLETMFEFSRPADSVEEELVYIFRKMNPLVKKIFLAIGRTMANLDGIATPSEVVASARKSK